MKRSLHTKRRIHCRIASSRRYETYRRNRIDRALLDAECVLVLLEAGGRPSFGLPHDDLRSRDRLEQQYQLPAEQSAAARTPVSVAVEWALIWSSGRVAYQSSSVP